MNDEMLRLAVERKFETMGEAARRLVSHDPETASRLTGLSLVIGFRNVLIHGYDKIEHGEVWEVITDKLPPLLEEIDSILPEPPIVK